MSKKLIVLSKQLKSISSTDVDSRFYDENMNPLIIKDTSNVPYHLVKFLLLFVGLNKICLMKDTKLI